MILRRLTIIITFLTAWVWSHGQQINAVPDYVFRNQMSVGRNAVTDTAAYFSIGPRYGANKGFMPPIVGDTATFSSGKRNGLLIFSVQKNKFLYWDSVRVQWSDMAGSSGTYITGTGITGYLPQFNGTTTIDTSGLFTLGSRLGIGTSSFAYTSATSSIELNGTSGGIVGFKRNDSARGYLWHTGDNMELANTVAGAISFNTNSSTRGSISSAGVWRLNNLAGTGDRVVVASSNGTLSASTSVTGLVDTTTISTRAWRQKGDDSLGAIVATKGSGTVTSVATGYGLSGGTITTTGTLLVDTLNIATRAWRQKGLDSLAALEVSGSGTTNYVTKFTAAGTIGNSQIFDNGSDIGIGTNSPQGFGSSRVLDLIGGTTTLGGVFRTATSDASVAGVLSSDEDGVKIQSTTASPLILGTGAMNRVHIFNNGNVSINDDFDEGYKLNVYGTQRTTGATSLASFSGNVAIGNITASEKIDIDGRIRVRTIDSTSSAINVLYADVNGVVKKTALPSTSIDTNSISTRAWRQKGLDSLAALEVSGSGTTNYVPKFTAASTIGNSQIFDNGTNVGIGTASPNEKLEVFGGNLRIAKSSGEVAFVLRTGTNEFYGVNNASLYGLYSNDYGSLFVRDKSSGYLNIYDKMGIFANGRVGVNTSTDAGYQFDINGTLRSVNGANFATTSGNVGIGTASPAYKLDVNGINNSTALYVDEIRSYQSANNISFKDNSGTVIGSINGSTRLFSWSLGNFAIGSSSASYKLDINGTLRSVNGANFATNGTGHIGMGTVPSAWSWPNGVTQFRFGGHIAVADNSFLQLGTNSFYDGSNYVRVNAGYSSRYLQNDGGHFWSTAITSTAGSTVTFNEQMRMTSNGELLINTTTDAGDYKLQVSGNIYNTGSAVLAATSGNVGIGTASPTSKLDDAGYQFDINGTLRSVNGANFATTSGNVGIGTASPTSKLDVIDSPTAINQLRVGQDATHKVLIGAETNYAEVQAIRVGVDFNKQLILQRQGGEVLIATTTDAGDYKLQVAGNVYASGLAKIGDVFTNTNSPFVTGGNIYTNGQSLAIGTLGANLMSFFTNNTERGRINSAGEWIIDASGTDAGDYKLQVVGNARIGTGKLDISSNTAFSMNVQRSGTSEVAGTFNNSNAILYLGAESSAGGAIFTGSSSYAAVIGSGAAYPLQFATNNVTRATINTNGELLINTLTDNGDFKLQVNGNALISGSIKTANGASSTAQPWHLGSVVATNVQLDTANYVEVEINGVYYRLAIVTPL